MILRLIPSRGVIFEKLESSQADYFACEDFLLQLFDRAVFMRHKEKGYKEDSIALFSLDKTLLLEVEMNDKSNKVFKKTGKILINIPNNKESNEKTLWFNERKIVLELYGILWIDENNIETYIDERIIDVLILFVKKWEIVNGDVGVDSINRFVFELYEKYNFKNFYKIK